MEVIVYQVPDHHRSRVICKAMLQGIRRAGDKVELKTTRDYGRPRGDVAVFYGFDPPLDGLMEDYRMSGRRAVYVDLGYWARKIPTRYEGHHKLAVNSRHPTDYFQAKAHSSSRINALGIRLRRWQKGGQHILVAGMGAKGANAEGFQPEEWERRTIRQLRKLTRREIVYRPKPNWPDFTHIEGTTLSSKADTIDTALKYAHAVVTHHSNVAVEALVLGIPVFVWGGVALPMGSSDLSLIETPRMPDGREQWLADLAWCQWSVPEMRTGEAWRYLKADGLLG